MIIDSVSSLWNVLCKDKRQHWLREGAQSDEIANLELQLGVSLPSEYIAFLNYTDGAILFQTEELLGTKPGWEFDESIITAKERLSIQSPPLPPGLIPFHHSGTLHCFRIKSSTNGCVFSVIEWNPVSGQSADEYDDFLDWANQYLIPVGNGRL